MEIFYSLRSFYEKLLKPDSNFVTNEKDILLATIKNKFLFWMYILFWFLTVAYICQLGLNPLLNMMFWLITVVYIAFLILCRRYPLISYNLFCALLICGNSIHYFSHPNKLDGAWTQILLNPILIYYISNNRFLPFISIIIETILLKYMYVPYLMSSEAHMDSFKSDFLSSLFSVSILLYLITLGADSQILTFQHAYIKTNIERDELEKHKILVLSFSHEIRNLINSLNGIIQICLIEGNPSQSMLSYLKEGKYCTDFLLHLMNNVLDSGKISINDLEFTSTKTSIYETLSESWGLASQLIKKKKIIGSIKIAKDVPDQLVIDKYRIGQILLNLIGNAVKFTDKGRVDVIVEYIPDQIEVTEETFYPNPYVNDEDIDEGIFSKNFNVSSFDDNYYTYYVGQTFKSISLSKLSGKGVLKISVKDTGQGIDPENIPKLFKQFSQLHSGYKKQIGTGLGLYITKKLCEGMKGDIKIFSKIGHGSTFVFCLATEAIGGTSSQNSLLRPAGKRFEDISAMIVDDEKFARNVLDQFMKKLKIKDIEEGVNGYEAYKKYVEAHKRGKPINFITIDINMPDWDGKTAVRKIRQYEAQNNLSPAVVVFISGNCLQSEIESCLNTRGDIKGDYFLKKPVGFEEIYKVVKHSFVS